MKQRMRAKYLLLAFVMMFTIGFVPVTVQAEEATVIFGSEEYTARSGSSFQIGVYISGESSVGEYYVEIEYDNRRLEYVRGGDSEEDGVIILEGTASRATMKYMLTFRAISGGTAQIAVKTAEVYNSDAANPAAFEITAFGSAPVSISGEDTVAPLEAEEEAERLAEEAEAQGAEESFQTDIPLVEDTPLAELIEQTEESLGLNKELYLVNLASYIPEDMDWEYQRINKTYNGEKVAYLTNPDVDIWLLYLMDEEENFYLYAYSEEKQQLYPCNSLIMDGEKYYYVSPYACSVWPEELTLDIIQKESIVYAMDLNGQCGFYKITSGNRLTAWDSAEGAASTYKQTVKLLIILGAALVIIAIVVGFAVHMDKGKQKTKKNTGGQDEDTLIVEDLSLDVTEEEIRAWQQEAQDAFEQTEEPVISVQNVTMKFKVAMSNVSGIKEYIIQLLKKQISYRELLALNHVSFNVYRGEVVGVIGTNGSGKSTLLRIVSGALKPTGGKVVVDHKKVQLLTLGTGFDMELTAKENVYLNGAIIGYSKEFIDAKYDEIVQFAELEGFMEEKVKNFSSGMVSRLGFAIATAGDAAEILILDEVLSVGDEFFRKKSLKRVKEMIHGGSTVLMVSHSMGTILENCSKVVWIEKGVMKMIGEPKTVCEAYRKMNG